MTDAKKPGKPGFFHAWYHALLHAGVINPAAR